MFFLPTPRLILRDLEEGDWADVYALGREPEVIRFQTWLRMDTPEQARLWVQGAVHHNQLQPRLAYNLAVVADGQMIGWLGFGRTPETARRDFEFGYALLPSAWGRGYMTEALGAALTFMFGPLGTDHVFGECDRDNAASVRGMERAGLRPVQVRREVDPETGAEREVRRFALDSAGGRRSQAVASP